MAAAWVEVCSSSIMKPGGMTYCKSASRKAVGYWVSHVAIVLKASFLEKLSGSLPDHEQNSSFITRLDDCDCYVHMCIYLQRGSVQLAAALGEGVGYLHSVMAKRKTLYYEALIGRREGTINEAGLQKRICGHPSIVARLQLDKKLQGHQGCVSRG